MVRKKKTAKKVQGTTEPIEETVEAPVEAPIVEPVIVEEPTASFVDETGKLLKLLGEAPAVPYITTIHEAVIFVDKYAKWKANVKAATT